MGFMIGGVLLLLAITAVLAWKTARPAVDRSIHTDSKDLLMAVRKIGIISRSITEPPILCGIAFSVRGPGLLLMAGHGHRASTQYLHVEEPRGKVKEFVLPQADVPRLVALLEATEGSVRIEHVGGRRIVVEGESVLEVEALEGRYPNLVEIFPPSFAHDFRIDRKAWLEALEPLDIEQGKALALDIADAHLRLGEREIPIRSTGVELAFLLDAGLVHAIVRGNEDRRLRFHFDTPTRPVMFSDGEGWSCLLMPIVAS